MWVLASIQCLAGIRVGMNRELSNIVLKFCNKLFAYTKITKESQGDDHQ